MLKRPTHRFHPPTTPNVSRPTSGVLANIIQGFKTEPIRPQKQKKFAIQASSVYARLLEKNYDYYGVPFKSPDIIEVQPPKKHEAQDEPELDFVDKVYLKLIILKSGKVRVKLIPHFLELWYNYYSKGKKPPIKTVIAAYKAIGFSDVFLQKIITNQKKRIEFAKKLEKIIEKIFDKSMTTKRKPVRAKVEEKVGEKVEEKVEEVEIIDAAVEDDDDDDDGPEEDEGILPEEEDDDAEEENLDDVCVDDFDE